VPARLTGGSKLTLVEYLYVDEKRVNSYFEQISSPVTYDKVPEWSADISITGPKAGGKQLRFARPYTMHEKISKLTEHLEAKGLTVSGRASEPEYMFPLRSPKAVFRHETCHARRIYIATGQSDSSPSTLNLWISLMDRSASQAKSRDEWQPGNLYLLEDYQGNDQPIRPMGSAYSSLQMLFGSSLRGGSAFTGIDIDLRDALDDQELRKEFVRDFSVDPTVALSRLGAQVGPPREIHSLYRIRTTFLDEDIDTEHGSITTFGYPIFIAVP
jgi:hypothetical protein